MNPETAYECAECANVFEDFEEAANCCGKGYYDVFFCGGCGEIYLAQHGADRCCQEEE